MNERELFEDAIVGPVDIPRQLQEIVDSIEALDDRMNNRGGAKKIDSFPYGPMADLKLIAKVAHRDGSVVDYYANSTAKAFAIRHLLIER